MSARRAGSITIHARADNASGPAPAVLCYSGTMSEQADTAGRREAAERLAVLAERASGCVRCALSRSRTQVVFGVGSAAAELMFVGEGPGFHEDKQGEPFVGQAGKLLTELLAGIGLSRPDVYIANVVKCRPPENRDPAPEEIEACCPHLMAQIGLIRPRVICTLGRFATKLLADTELGIGAIHGKAKVRELGEVSVVVFPVFHPAAALYTPANRKVLELDFAKLRVLLDKGPEALNQEATAGAAAGLEAACPRDTSGSSGPLPASGGAGGQASRQTEQLPLW